MLHGRKKKSHYVARCHSGLVVGKHLLKVILLVQFLNRMPGIAIVHKCLKRTLFITVACGH